MGIGSNSWVIGPDRSATGAAILANDPHLGIRMPSIWYQVSLHCEPITTACPLDVTGFSFAGMPGVIIGHNDQIAWGFTNLGPDVMDLYVERINPDDPNAIPLRRRVGRHGRLHRDDRRGRWRPGHCDRAQDQTRPDHLRRLRDSWRTSPTTAGIPLPNNYAISLRWTALDAGNAIVDAALQLNLGPGLRPISGRTATLRRARPERRLCRPGTATSATRPPGRSLSGRDGTVGFPYRGGAPSTNGPASSRSTICPSSTTRMRDT